MSFAGIRVLRFTFLLAVLVVPGVVIKPVAADTTICNTREGVYDPYRNDIELHVILKTCGTFSTATSTFSNTNHTISAYCFGHENPSEIDVHECSPQLGDFILESYNFTAFGQNNGVSGYQQSSLRLPGDPSFDPSMDKFNQTKSFSSTTVDFAQTRVRLQFTDDPVHDGGGEIARGIVLEVVSFIGNVRPFRMDWSDQDNNGLVNILDVADVAFYYNQTCSTPNTPQCYWDLNRNQVVDQNETDLVASFFGKSFGFAHYPGKSCPARVLDRPGCVGEQFGVSLSGSSCLRCPGSVTRPTHPGWKDMCAILPTIERSYCEAYYP